MTAGAFDSSLERDPDIESSLEERALGGLGLFLVQKMMDDVTYQRREELNVITLRKNTAEQARAIGAPIRVSARTLRLAGGV